MSEQIMVALLGGGGGSAPPITPATPPASPLGNGTIAPTESTSKNAALTVNNQAPTLGMQPQQPLQTIFQEQPKTDPTSMWEEYQRRNQTPIW